MIKKCTLIFSILLSINYSAQIPTSTRSKKAVASVTQSLKKEFKTKGLIWGSNMFIRIFKHTDELEVWVKKGDTFSLFKTYEICYYSGGLGSKKKQGDGKSPEGFYYTKPFQLNPYSNFHLSFNIGYPNSYDRVHGYTGSAIMIHGNCVSIGCYAMTDARINEIYTLLNAAYKNKQPLVRIHIFPFRMSKELMTLEAVKKSPWYSFWKNLKQGYDYFEEHKLPPNVEVKNKKYIFN